MNCRIFVLLLLFAPLSSIFAQKAYKELRNLLKEQKGTQAATLVEKLSADSSLAADPKLYDFGKQAQIHINNVENEKVYLKKAYDTLTFFRSTYRIFEFVTRCDELEQKRLATDGTKMKFRKENREILHRYYRNLSAAGRYYYSKKMYSESAKVMKMYLSLPDMPIWGDNRDVKKTDTYQDNVYIYQCAVFGDKQYDKVTDYKDLTLADTASRCNYLQILALSAQALGQTADYIYYLKEGLAYHAQTPFFFTRLTDYYTQLGDYRASLHLADSLLQVNCTNLLFLEAKNLALLNLERYEEAIQASLFTLRLNNDAVETYFYIGAAYCNLASEIVLPTNFNSKEYRELVEKQKTYYRMAQPHMERYRALAPTEKKRWAPLLYRIYLALNLGKQFDEIDQIMKNI